MDRTRITRLVNVLKFVKADGMNLRFISKNRQNKLVIITAVNQCGKALQFASFQDEDIVKAAVRQDGLALHYAKIQNWDICWLALHQNIAATQYVDMEWYEVITHLDD